jgi:hypothetical protein
MQPNQITLAVDELNNETTVDAIFDRNEEYLNRTVYVHENHTLASKDVLSFYRNTPAASGNFPGMVKVAAKFSRDVSVAGVDQTTTIVSSSIGEFSFRIPIGATAAFCLELRQRMIALLDDDTVMDALVTKLSI